MLSKALFNSVLDIPKGKVGKWEIKRKVVKPGETLTIVSMRDAIFSGKKSQEVLVSMPLTIHQLFENGNLWMSDSPQEQELHKDIVDKCKGDVLIGGLGLGYIASMLDQKNDVNSITVVELEKDVIGLVWKHLKLKKAKIVQADLFDYLKYTKDKFSWAYYDIWAPTGEDILYTHIRPLKTLSKGKVPFKHILCWAEETMLGQMMWNLHTTIQFCDDPKMGVMRIPENSFRDYYKVSRTHWAFYNWLRKTKPGKEEAIRFAKHYCSTYTNYDKWVEIWGHWDYKEGA